MQKLLVTIALTVLLVACVVDAGRGGRGGRRGGRGGHGGSGSRPKACRINGPGYEHLEDCPEGSTCTEEVSLSGDITITFCSSDEIDDFAAKLAGRARKNCGEEPEERQCPDDTTCSDAHTVTVGEGEDEEQVELTFCLTDGEITFDSLGCGRRGDGDGDGERRERRSTTTLTPP